MRKLSGTLTVFTLVLAIFTLVFALQAPVFANACAVIDWNCWGREIGGNSGGIGDSLGGCSSGTPCPDLSSPLDRFFGFIRGLFSNPLMLMVLGIGVYFFFRQRGR